MRTLLCSSYRYGMTVTVILIIWDIHVSGADVIGIQHAEVGDPAHRQMLWPLRLTKYPSFRFCLIEHLSSCAVQLPRLVAGCARRARPGGPGQRPGGCGRSPPG